MSNWTLVTAYFDLTQYYDASPPIKERDNTYYINHSEQTLSIPYNLVIYCEKKDFEKISSIRKLTDPLDKKTKYIFTELDNFSEGKFKEYRDKINDNRKKNPYHFDERNTASYYLLCVSRYLMLIETIKENYFNSTHFAWINFCISRMGHGIKYLPEVLSTNRDKFSTCYIDYIPLWFINNTAEYFKRGYCSMCSGFFTGNSYYMKKVCEAIYQKFLYYLDLGYGHADEQLYSPVYFENKSLFDHYFGDYQEMITNYSYINDRPEAVIYNFIKTSFHFKDFSLCRKACNVLLTSLNLGKCVLDDNYKNTLFYYAKECDKYLE